MWRITPPAQVTSITLNLPLHKAGMLAGDIITSVDGKEVASGEELAAYFDEHPLEDLPVTLTYEREEKRRAQRSHRSDIPMSVLDFIIIWPVKRQICPAS